MESDNPMDIFSHGLWAGALAKAVNVEIKKKKKDGGGQARPLNFWQMVFWGAFPDLFAFALPFIAVVLGLLTGQVNFADLPRPGQEEPPFYDGFWAFELARALYNLSHSAVIFAAVFLIVYLIWQRPVWELSGWLLHILIDIPTHSYKYFPTPFLWPVSKIEVNGYSWGHPWFLIANYGAIAIVYFLLRGPSSKQEQSAAKI